MKGGEQMKAGEGLEREIIPEKVQFKADVRKGVNLVVLYRESNCISETLNFKLLEMELQVDGNHGN